LLSTLYPLPSSPVTDVEKEVVDADITTIFELLVAIATTIPFGMNVTGVGIETIVNTFDAIIEQE
jgi:hypothetical protein